MTECAFCDYSGPSNVLHDWDDAYVIEHRHRGSGG